MEAKRAGLGAGVAGLGLSTALAVLQLGGVTVPGWVMLALLIPSISMILTGGLLFAAGLWAGDEPALRRKAAVLSRELLNFVAERRRDDPSGIPHWSGLPRNASEARRRRAFEDGTQAMIAYSTETMNRYNGRYQARALKLFDDLRDSNLVDPNQRFWFEHPTNPLGIEEIAKILGVVGEGGGTAKRSFWQRTLRSG